MLNFKHKIKKSTHSQQRQSHHPIQQKYTRYRLDNLRFQAFFGSKWPNIASKEEKDQSVELNETRVMNNLPKVESVYYSWSCFGCMCTVYDQYDTQIINLLTWLADKQIGIMFSNIGIGSTNGQLKYEKKSTIELPNIKMYPVSLVTTEDDRNDIDPIY
ncbi:hypothetical protein RFI_05520 [Reticulomyxa filosa]|uniref:Uncharacterized protein n=1 Tax=Reticulomyxa filosa TaxID=46433 RepID=X6NZ64_RETFI|nr:hypothetical protein RFI_05520 [Reticulomyxa filosa]|eukprot:ETO31600.1 hypothetical protein RFI_05520 [Reticulomyxa filosa]